MGTPNETAVLIYNLSESAIRICKKLYPECKLYGITENDEEYEYIHTYSDVKEACDNYCFECVFYLTGRFYLPDFREMAINLKSFKSIKKIVIASVYAPKVMVIRHLYKMFNHMKIMFVDLMDIGFEEIYTFQSANEVPWYYTQADADIYNYFTNSNIDKKSKILDVGAGSGHQAMHLSACGYFVTATELNIKAFTISDNIPNLQLVVDDITNTQLKEQFDYVCDRGCFHNIDPSFRSQYVHNVYKLLKNDGRLLIKTLVSREQISRISRPFTLDKNEFNHYFQNDFIIENQKQSYFQGEYLENNEMPAMFSILKKK